MTLVLELDPDVMKLYLRAKMECVSQGIEKLEFEQAHACLCACSNSCDLNLDRWPWMYERDLDVLKV